VKYAVFRIFVSPYDNIIRNAGSFFVHRKALLKLSVIILFIGPPGHLWTLQDRVRAEKF